MRWEDESKMRATSSIRNTQFHKTKSRKNEKKKTMDVEEVGD